MADPLAEIRAELQRVKVWPESIAHVPNVLGRCMERSCRWPCTEAEAAQDAAKLAKALERAMGVLEGHEPMDAVDGAPQFCDTCWVEWPCDSVEALSDIAQLLREE